MAYHHKCRCFTLLIVLFSFLCLQSRAVDTASVFFLDSKSHHYFCPISSIASPETGSMLLSEVGAAVSILLGFAPPATLPVASSFKLNEVLMPNPFDRPRTVFLLEVRGAEDSPVIEPENIVGQNIVSSAHKRRVNVGQTEADIQLPDQHEVSVISLNEPMGFDSDIGCTDKDLIDIASLLGGSYDTDIRGRVMEGLTIPGPLRGVLTLPTDKGVFLELHLSQRSDREFASSLVSLVRNVRRVMEMHQDLSGSMRNQAELITGYFDGMKDLSTKYLNGVEFFILLISKMFDSLQTAYKGQIVGVILFNGTSAPESEKMLNLKFTSRPSPRWLEEIKGTTNSTAVAEVVLVRRTLAWITGIILLISTVLGIYFLLNMPLTRDTLLYSNVKLD